MHISNIARARVPSVATVFEVGEQVKVMAIKSPSPTKYAFRYVTHENSPQIDACGRSDFVFINFSSVNFLQLIFMTAWLVLSQTHSFIPLLLALNSRVRS